MSRHRPKPPLERIARALERSAKAHERIADVLEASSFELTGVFFGPDADRKHRAFRVVPLNE